jgi:hypothetical protein
MPDALLERSLVGFGRLLRTRGHAVVPPQMIRFQAAVGAFDAVDLDDIYWAGRACFAVQPSAAHDYDVAFREYFLLGGEELAVPDPRSSPEPDGEGSGADPAGSAPLDRDAGDEDGDDSADQSVVGDRASAVERLHVTPFAECTPEEIAALIREIHRLGVRPPPQRSRRLRPDDSGARLDLRRMTRRALKTQAEVIVPAWRAPRTRPRRLVLLLDVSRSMTPYPRFYLHLAYALAQRRLPIEVVCFGTRITRVTRQLTSHRSLAALDAATAAVLDWHGGTRIADAVAGLRRIRTVRAKLRGAVVVIFSDGLEHGDPADLGLRMRELHDLVHSVVWVNPLAGDARYEPTARGMQAALPYIDELVAGDTMAALANLAAVLRKLGAHTP